MQEADAAVPERREFLAAAMREGPIRTLVYPDRPFNFSWTINWAAAQAAGGVLCLLNDDTQVLAPDWLNALAARVCLDGVGAAGALLRYEDGRVQHAGVVLGPGGVAAHAFRGLAERAGGYFGRAGLEQDCSAVTAGCMAVRRQAFEALGGFDERFAIAFNDVDFCLRLRRAGWRVVWTPTAVLCHRESASLGGHDADRGLQFAREARLMRDLWGPVLDDDPFYNPNLSLDRDRLYRLAVAPRRQPPWRAAAASVPADARDPPAAQRMH
jgi:hypothetical protein